MKNIVSLVALLVSALLVSGCGDDSANQSSDVAAPVSQEVAAPVSTADDLSWDSLNELQKSVLGVGEKVWPNIPLEKRREMVAMADNWTKTSAADQYKMLNELRDYVGIAHIGPAAKK